MPKSHFPVTFSSTANKYFAWCIKRLIHYFLCIALAFLLNKNVVKSHDARHVKEPYVKNKQILNIKYGPFKFLFKLLSTKRDLSEVQIKIENERRRMLSSNFEKAEVGWLAHSDWF